MSLGANLLSIFVPSYFLTVTKINETEDGSEITEFTNGALVESFIQYHNSHTHLRLITVEENRKRKKKKL